MRFFTLVPAVLIVTAGCSDSLTGPKAEAASPIISAEALMPRLSVQVASNNADLRSTLLDVQERLLPQLSSGVAVDELKTLVERAGQKLDSDAAAARAALAAAQKLVDPLGDGSDPDLGDISTVHVIRLLLDNVAFALAS
jgi:hypothetical protein